MVGRYANLGVYKELFQSGDFIKVMVGGALIPISVGISKVSGPEPSFFVSMLFLVSVAINGAPIVMEAVQGILKRKINVDELVSIAIVACILNGNYMEAATVSFIMVLGALVEEFVSDSARKAIEGLVEVTPEEAVVEVDGREVKKRVAELIKGDTVLVRAGETIPVDGVIASGKTTVDESSLTGESIPVFKESQGQVSAGTMNIDGFIRVTATRIGEDSTIGKVIRLVEAAEQSKADSARIVDEYAKWFTPTILFIALLTYLITGDITRAITVLIVGCPCSFLLAGPVSTVAAIGRAARSGIMVKGGTYLERVATATGFFFDKTGTLTTGEPEVVKVTSEAGLGEREILSLAAAVEQGSLHPLAKAIVGKAENMGCEIPEAEEITTVAGVGVTGLVGGRSVWVGSGSGMEEEGITAVQVKVDGEDVGTIGLLDRQRPVAEKTLRKLKGQGVADLAIVSGDQASAVEKIAADVGISVCHSRLKPQEKMAVIEGYSKGSLVYVGDGINDAPALKAADAGIAMGLRGSDVALETADIVLMNDRLELLPFLVKLSRKMARTIKVNIAISLIINILAIVAGSFGLLTPVMGAIAHNVGSIAVVLLSASIALMKE